jgi:hypothetical protein
LPEEYPWILLVVSAICTQCFFVSIFITSPARKRIFTKEFMKKFEDLHESEYKKRADLTYGLPDTGSGRYSKELSYKQWYEFNNAQRAHYNFVE